MEYVLFKFIGFNLLVITAIAIFCYCQYWGGYWSQLCRPQMHIPDGLTLADVRLNRLKHFLGTAYGFCGMFLYTTWAYQTGWYVAQLNTPEVEQFITMFTAVGVIVITTGFAAEWVFSRKEKG